MGSCGSKGKKEHIKETDVASNNSPKRIDSPPSELTLFIPSYNSYNPRMIVFDSPAAQTATDGSSSPSCAP